MTSTQETTLVKYDVKSWSEAQVRAAIAAADKTNLRQCLEHDGGGKPREFIVHVRPGRYPDFMDQMRRELETTNHEGDGQENERPRLSGSGPRDESLYYNSHFL